MMQAPIPKPATVFVVDDDNSVREGLKWLITSVQLPVETYSSATEFTSAYDPSWPGCLVLDVRMPDKSGFDLQIMLQQRRIKLPIIFISGHADVPMCVRAFEKGACAFLEKPINHQRLIDHIHRSIELDAQRRDRDAKKALLNELLHSLTHREREVMQLLVTGNSMKRIATQLGICVQTCAKHRSRILNKLHVENDVDLTRLVINN